MARCTTAQIQARFTRACLPWLDPSQSRHTMTRPATPVLLPRAMLLLLPWLLPLAPIDASAQQHTPATT